MEKIKFTPSFHHIMSHGGGGLSLTLYGVKGDSIVLELDEEQVALLDARSARSFYARCSKEKLLYEIDNAGSNKNLEQIAERYDLCDVCAFGDINHYGVYSILKVIAECLYKYPRLRSRLCFLGTHHGMEKLLVRLEEGDVSVLDRFHLQHICPGGDAKKLGKLLHRMLSALMEEHEGYIATALFAFGLFDAVLLDKNDFEGYAYLKIVSDLRYNEESGFHPRGCNSPESVVYHELGHLLDQMCNFSESPAFKSFYNSLAESDIKNGLSEYATASMSEFIAEAFAERMCNPVSRPIATKVVGLLDAVYRKL